MIIHKTVLAVAACAALPKNCHESRYTLDGVSIRPTGIIAATDGTIAFHITPVKPFPDTEMPVRGLPPFDHSPTEPVFLNTLALETITKRLPKTTSVPILQCVQVGVTATGDTFAASTDLETVSAVTLKDGANFPMSDRYMIPSDRAETTINLSPDLLARIAKAAKLAGARSVRLGVKTGGTFIDPVRVRFSGEQCSVEGVVMGIRGNEGE